MKDFLPKEVQPGSPQDAAVGEVIARNETEDFSQELSRTDDWNLYYHLSSVRCGIWNWYFFRPGARLLEVGGGFGAVTGLFCDRCAFVTVTERNPYRAAMLRQRYRNRDNLQVFAGELDDLPVEERYDYLVLTGVLERQCDGTADKAPYADYLRRVAAAYLKPDGVLLLAVDNRLGLHYFCGDRDRFTGRPFDSINNYPHGTHARGFTKKEITDIVEQAGLRQHKFFYPLPDHRVPQMVFSQDYLGGTAIDERLSTYAVQQDTQLVWERSLYKDIQENGVLEFFSNSFLLECSADQPASPVQFAVLSTDRGRDCGMATTIHADDTVHKRALYPEGCETVAKAVASLQALQARGVPVVPCRMEGPDQMVMPRIQDPVLNGVIKENYEKKPEMVVKSLELLYHYILQSSSHLPPEQNALLDWAPALDYGPILEQAYLDMVPVNCFCAADGTLRFYDQEYIRQAYPAKFVLYRAVKYTYWYNPGLEEKLPMAQMKDHFGLTPLWEVFEQAEQKFIAGLRKLNAEQAYYRCVNQNIGAIYQRCEKLGN